jgi:hypothetical protein
MARPPSARPISEHREVIARTIRQVMLNRMPAARKIRAIRALKQALDVLGGTLG